MMHATANRNFIWAEDHCRRPGCKASPHRAIALPEARELLFAARRGCAAPYGSMFRISTRPVASKTSITSSFG